MEAELPANVVGSKLPEAAAETKLPKEDVSMWVVAAAAAMNQEHQDDYRQTREAAAE